MTGIRPAYPGRMGTERGEPAGDPEAPGDAAREQRVARALGSPLRMRILRFCLHESRTNREIAAEFGLNPGTSLHHVRTLLDTGMLAAEEPRSGRRGAREIPYRATGLSWGARVPDIAPVLIQTFLAEIEGVPADQLVMSRLGLKLDADHERELVDELSAVLERWKARPSDTDGRPLSIFLALHPEWPRATPGEGTGRPRR